MNDEDTTPDPLFTIMRFQVLTAALIPGVRERLNDAYVFAWDQLVFPFFHESASWHKPFPKQFLVTSEMMNELSKYLDDMWRAKTVPSFYQLESRYEVRTQGLEWDRSKLIDACQYMHLNKLFDEEFWRALIKPGDHPSEAASITGTYKRDTDLYFH